MMSRFLLAIMLAGAALLTGCDRGEEGFLEIAVIASDEDLLDDGMRLSPGAQHLRGAIAYGLVGLDADGEVVPGLAERWLPTNDGRSFIFRLRDTAWPDGSELTSESVRLALLRNLGALDGTSLGLDLSPVEDVRAMSGRVIEIRLSSPVPDLLRLLAQPELALRSAEGPTGPMVMDLVGDGILLSLRPPIERGLPVTKDWQDQTRRLSLRPMPAPAALAAFEEGRVDIVLGGGLGYWPRVDTGPLSRGTVQVDPALGLLGLLVHRERGILDNERTREALAMALDREALLAPFGIGGWPPTTRLVASGLPRDPGYMLERWQTRDMVERRAEAKVRIARWQRTTRESQGESEANREREPEGDAQPAADPRLLTVALPQEPGFDMLFDGLAAQWAQVGVQLDRADDPATADLVLVDRTARYAAPRWFLNQFHCSLDRGLCSEDADFLVAQALLAPDPETRARLLAEAEGILTLANVYIPIGRPLRWSLVRGSVDAYLPNSWAHHPLPPLAQTPR